MSRVFLSIPASHSIMMLGDRLNAIIFPKVEIFDHIRYLSATLTLFIAVKKVLFSRYFTDNFKFWKVSFEFPLDFSWVWKILDQTRSVLSVFCGSFLKFIFVIYFSILKTIYLIIHKIQTFFALRCQWIKLF